MNFKIKINMRKQISRAVSCPAQGKGKRFLPAFPPAVIKRLATAGSALSSRRLVIPDFRIAFQPRRPAQSLSYFNAELSYSSTGVPGNVPGIAGNFPELPDKHPGGRNA